MKMSQRHRAWLETVADKPLAAAVLDYLLGSDTVVEDVRVADIDRTGFRLVIKTGPWLMSHHHVDFKFNGNMVEMMDSAFQKHSIDLADPNALEAIKLFVENSKEDDD